VIDLVFSRFMAQNNCSLKPYLVLALKLIIIGFLRVLARYHQAGGKSSPHRQDKALAFLGAPHHACQPCCSAGDEILVAIIPNLSLS
jgi:hypothetical protein